MYSLVTTSIIQGIKSIPVYVEADVSDGMPLFEMVGSLSPEVKESKERVRTALKNTGYILPPKRITINFIPANIRKTGSGFDLPVVAAVLCAIGIVPEEALKNTMVVGEISLSGEVKPVNGILPMVAEAKEIKAIAAKYQVPFVINDDIYAAKEIDADGVHVGQSDMEAGAVREKLGPDKILGVSARTVEQALLAQERGADYLGVGAVFATGSKADAAELPHETLKAICEAVSIPVVAIGGITAENISQLKGTGICGVAVISAIYAQNNIKEAAEELKEAVDKIV